MASISMDTNISKTNINEDPIKLNDRGLRIRIKIQK